MSARPVLAPERAAIAALGLALTMCGGPEPWISPPAAPDCQAIAAYRDYLYEVAEHARHAMPAPPLLARHEAATVRLWLSATGALRSWEVQKATSLQAAAWGSEVARDAAPYPRPLPGIRRCVAAWPVTVILISLGPEPAKE